jgi:hypothetical protein
MPQGISSHGTILRIKPSIADPSGASAWVAGTWYEVAELGDLQMPGLTRNEFDITSHNRDIDTYVLGVLRREPVTFPLFFNRAINSHKILRGMQLNGDPTTNMSVGFELSSPDGEAWLFSGGVKDMAETAPVDGVKTVNMTVRATGSFILNGVEYGL